MNSAILITYNEDDVVREALALCDSADYKVLHSIKQDFLRAPKYGISTGKIQELKDIIISAKQDLVLVVGKSRILRTLLQIQSQMS